MVSLSRMGRLGAVVGLGVGLLFGMVSGGEADTGSTLDVVVPLGQVFTASLTLSNVGQTTTTVRLVEGPPPAPPAAALAAPLRVPLPNRLGPVTTELRAALAADGTAEAIIYLTEQADLRAAAAIPDWDARGRAVVDALQAQAAHSQPPLLAALRARGLTPRAYWIVNALAVRLDASTADWLAGQSAVALVAENALHQLPAPTAAPVDDAGALAWGVERVRAPLAWATWGARGQGIVVANLDSGVAYQHPALLAQYRGHTSLGDSHAYNWFDAVTKPSPFPVDAAGHGTHTMGTMVGGAAPTATGDLHTGVAPAARWIAARACSSLFCTDELLLASAQWVLAPTDLSYANPRPDLRPHIVNNSWGGPGETDWYTGYVQAWTAAGIFSVFSNGNEGSVLGCGTSTWPGNAAAAFAVGATDAEDLIADFSSRGPTLDGRTRPDLSAPGVNVPSTWPDGGVRQLSGTSMATPHVAGTVALMWSANPALIGDIAATRRLLTTTVQARTSPECGDAPGATPNNVYGWGRLDAYRAVQAAVVEVPWLSAPAEVALPGNAEQDVAVVVDARQVPQTGTYSAYVWVVREHTRLPIRVTLTVVPPLAPTARLTGQLRDRWTGAGVFGRVSAPTGPAWPTDPQGYFTVTVPAGPPLAVTAQAAGYLPAAATLTTTADFSPVLVVAADAPHLSWTPPPLTPTLAFGERLTASVTLSNTGSQPLSIITSVPPLEWTLTGPEPAGALFDLSAYPPLPLGDDMVYTNAVPLGFGIPLFGQTVQALYISSNGWVSADRPGEAAPRAACLPNASLPLRAIAPLWADFDPAHPSGGGAIRAGQVAADTFVVSYEDVPLWQADPQANPPRYSFQAVFYADGRIEFRYGALSAMPNRWASGVTSGAERGQGLGCYYRTATLTLSQQKWVWRNQPAPTPWLTAAPATLTVPAGGAATLTVTVWGNGYVPWRVGPHGGQVWLSTNDPLQPHTMLEVQALFGPPAVTVWVFPIFK